MTENYFFQSPGPIFLDLGFAQLRYYGLCYAIAFIACFYAAKELSKKSTRFNFNEDEISNLLFTVIASGLIGARLWYVILSWDYFSSNPLEIIKIWHGGQSIQGGIIGSMIGCTIFQKERLAEKLALVATVAPLGQAIGRWGNFFNEEAFGTVTELPWKLYISHTGEFHHPTFLYEALWNLICFLILREIFLREEPQPNQLIGAYLLLYSLGRIVIECFRVDSLYLFSIPAATIISTLGIIIGSMLLIYSNDD